MVDAPDRLAVATGAPARPLRVLLIDGDQALRATLAGLLEDEGVEVVGQAGDGAAGVELAGLLAPDVVVTELYLPGLDGLGATRRIRAAAPATQVVVHTLDGGPGLAEEAVRAGAFALVPKDGRPRGLCDAVLAAGVQAGG